MKSPKKEALTINQRDAPNKFRPKAWIDELFNGFKTLEFMSFPVKICFNLSKEF